MAELRLVTPATGALLITGQPFSVHFDQEGLSGDGASTLQFSNSEGGPWTTCQPNAGPLQAPVVQWTAQNPSYQIDGCVLTGPTVWARGGVWADQGVQGPPLWASNAARWNPKEVGGGGEPPGRPR